MADLRPYRAKRRFGITPEPQGSEPFLSGDNPSFVVQKHRASRLHYDFRLEIGGALRSWAVPEGPCLDTKVRRLAVQTEDHPLSYGGFEGRIPAGQYGAGVVIVWDRGGWVTLADDVEAALAKGELKFRLLGEKLKGGWTLVRLAKDPKNWLLIKERDDEVRRLDEYDVLKEAPRSVMSGLTVEELAEQMPESEAPATRKATPAKKATARIAGAKPAPMPGPITPQLCDRLDAPPAGKGWVHEIKYDGYRTIVRIEGGDVRLITRNKHDWTHRYRPLDKAFRDLKCKSAVIDGEVTVQDARGVTSIALLETALSEGRGDDLTFFAFDLLYLDGYDLTGATLLDRKRALAALIGEADPRAPIQFSEHMEGDASEFFAHACRMGLEGIVSKRADARYVEGRTKTWAKVKRAYTGDFVVVGYTVTTPKMVSALVVADEAGDGTLSFVGRVSSGLTEQSSRDLFKQLSARKVDKAVVEAPRIPGVTWTEPAAVARVAFNSRAPDGAPRQPVLLGVTPYATPAKATRPRLVTDRDLASIRLTNPEREMFAGSGVTKLDLAIYYARVGDWMLPELKDRPVSLIRCPTGALKDCFYQRHAFAGLPAGIGTIDLSDDEGRQDYIYIETAQGYLALSQFGAVEFHPWGCRVDDPEHPDRLVADLDPDPAVAWPQVRAAAEMLRDKLKGLGLEPFVRTTGGKGLHLVCALERGSCDWKTLKDFAEAFARSAAKDAPQVFTGSPTKDARKGRIYIDWLRNARGSSAVASYSLRANPEFTVATPLDWSELRTIESPRAYNRTNVLRRLARLAKDPWDGLEQSAAVISRKAKRDVGLKEG